MTALIMTTRRIAAETTLQRVAAFGAFAVATATIGILLTAAARTSAAVEAALAELKSANSLRGDTIHIGQNLTIPGTGSTPMVSEHRIARGETLSEIAERYRVSLASLRRANNLSGDKIMVGQVLKIPTS